MDKEERRKNEEDRRRTLEERRRKKSRRHYPPGYFPPELDRRDKEECFLCELFQCHVEFLPAGSSLKS